ncbi:MAG TPA: hypothetical protein HPP66_00580 [Planctomycetes bacterium]|nr:hypothetical protein [Planctomycetota bacterium]
MLSAINNTNDAIRSYLQPAFLICAAVLVLSGIVMPKPVKKKPLPLKKSLDLLDEKALAPYKVLEKPKITNQEVLESLGTEDYIQWILEDSEATVDSPVRKCSLFITYYALPDRVPHVPEECYTGGGHQRLTSDSVTFEINKEDIVETIPARYLVFARTSSNYWGMDTKFPVLYLFNVNEVYASSREDARFALNKNIFSKYSYFSKVEWKFFNTRFGKRIYPGKEEAITASQKLLSVILPILEEEHWPDREK